MSDSFNQFFTTHYLQRWTQISESFLFPKSYLALGEKNPLELSLFDSLVPYCFTAKNNAQSDAYYYLDAASYYCARALDVRPGEHVLDLCAAPGGKTLILGWSLQGEGRLVSNELSQPRKLRLKKVIETYLPKNFQDIVTVTSHDSTKWCLYEQNMYDKILLDAPCSSERHLVEQKKTDEWSVKRSKRLAAQQWTMLSSALITLKVGGKIVYSTCSINPLENDHVIEKLLSKRSEQVKIHQPHFEIGEATKYGWIFLPDRTNLGPLYFTVIEKLL